STSAPCSPRPRTCSPAGPRSRGGAPACSTTPRRTARCSYSHPLAPGEQDLRRFFDTAPVGMYRSNADGRFVFVNPALVALLGYDHADDVLALDLARDVYVDAAQRARIVEQYRDLGIAEGIDVTWRTRSGDILIVRLYSRVVRT